MMALQIETDAEYPIRTLPAESIGEIVEFYGANDYHQSVGNSDQFIVAEKDGEIIGAVRLGIEQGTLVLRGMRVASSYRSRGIGARLLAHAISEINGQECYCIPFNRLCNFYRRAGFEVIESSVAPAFLSDRLHTYIHKLNLDVILMRRAANPGN